MTPRTVLMTQGQIVAGTLSTRDEDDVDTFVSKSGLPTYDLVVLRNAHITTGDGKTLFAALFALERRSIVGFGVEGTSSTISVEELLAATSPMVPGRG
jgi:hypothetical protein